MGKKKNCFAHGRSRADLWKRIPFPGYKASESSAGHWFLTKIMQFWSRAGPENGILPMATPELEGLGLPGAVWGVLFDGLVLWEKVINPLSLQPFPIPPSHPALCWNRPLVCSEIVWDAWK